MKKLFLVILAGLALYGEALACTSAIVTAQRSSEGAPLLWKHRDAGTKCDTRVEYVTSSGYAYTAIVPNTKAWNKSVLAGINEKGFGIFNTATHDLPKATQEEYEAVQLKKTGGFSFLMAAALKKCATVDEFEELLKTTKRKNGFNTNYGVGDATGAVAYFEVWDLGYKRYDVNERESGYDVRANFSFAATGKRGASARRYNVVMKQMKAHNDKFTPQQFIGYSRSYNSIKYGDLLANDKQYVCSNHSVARATSVSSVVLVCDGNNPRMLVTNGHPVPGLALPVYVNAKKEIPKCLNGEKMRVLCNDFQGVAYKKLGKKKYQLNKEVAREVLKIKQPVVEMPKVMPENMKKFNARLDKMYNKHEKKVRKVINRYSAQ